MGAARGEQYRAREARENWGKWKGEAGDAFYGLGATGSCSREVATGRRDGRGIVGVVERLTGGDFRGESGEKGGGRGATGSHDRKCIIN
uniref:Uncharacterized protein n=1 Tax=Oryza sativa subsp. japonica TaxID=39947 RepID=Q33BA8_ORYSJ|nr:hypothetical protein LOC_Os10g03630 [Oryza sativa Japonica Group]